MWLNPRSKRGEEWIIFATNVLAHIDSYTVKQYGDLPDDMAAAFSASECITQLRKYCTRHGNTARGKKEQERDFYKMAHYACIAWAKEVGDASRGDCAEVVETI